MQYARAASLVVPALLAACGVVVTPQPPAGTAQGQTKTVSTKIQAGTNTVVSRNVNVVAPGVNLNAVPTDAGNQIWTYAIPGSAAWPQGTAVNIRWRVEYRFLGVSTQVNNAAQNFTVGPPPALVLPNARVCMRQGETVEVPIDIQSGTATAAITVTPASLATPTPASLPVTTAGNSFNLTGVQLGDGSMTAAATGVTSDSVNVRVIEAVATPVLVAPLNNAEGVFLGNSPPPGNPATVSYELDWQDTPGADDYRVHFTTESGAETFTNSSASEITLSAPQGTEVRWKIQAQFDNCPNGSTFGPESEERTFTVWAREE